MIIYKTRRDYSCCKITKDLFFIERNTYLNKFSLMDENENIVFLRFFNCEPRIMGIKNIVTHVF